MLIGTLIKEIIVFDDKIEIFLNAPIQTERTNPDESRDFSFYKGFSFMTILTEKNKHPYAIQMSVEMFVK